MSRPPAGGAPPEGGESLARNPGNSVIRFLQEKTGEAPRVTLRDEDSASVSAPVIDPSSKEKLSVPHGRGNYQLMGEIARGGMGVVLKGHDTDLGRDIAVKVLDKRLCERMDVVQRFVEEAQIGGQLQHPGIVPVYELGLMEDERPYFTMKLVKGRTLAALLAQRETPDSNRGRLIDIFESVCQTMAYAHSRGVIHRDLKPANIMVGAFGEVQVVDWGLAKVLVRGGTADEKRSRQVQEDRTILETVRSEGSGSGSQSLVGSVLGTPAYMPPEQASGQVMRLDERSDVFALGAILCEILTGSPPYVGEPREVIMAASQAELDDAYARLDACGTDAVLIKATKQCLMAAPAARPADAGVLAERIHDYVMSNEERAHRAEVEAAAAGVRAQEERKARRLTLALGAAVVAIVILGSGGWLWVQSERAAQQRQESARAQESADRDRALRAEVNEALNEAAVLEGGQRWSEALASAERARALAEGGGASEELLASVNKTLAELNEGLIQDQRREEFRLDTQRLLDELREVSQPDEQVEDALKDEQFRNTFLAHGIDLDADELDVAAEQLTRRGLGSEVALSLDAWGELRRVRRNADGALRLLELAHLVDPDPDRAHLREAMAVRDLEELRYLARVGFADQPASTFALLATSLARLEDRELALSVFRSGLEVHPDDFQLNYLLAQQLIPAVEQPRTDEELEEAEALLRSVLALDPKSAWARLSLGKVYRNLGELERAIPQFDFAIALEPELGNHVYRKAETLMRLERFDEAKAQFEVCLDMKEPAWVAGWSLAHLAVLEGRSGSTERALQLAREAWDSGTSAGYFIRIYMLFGYAVVAAMTGEEAPLIEARRVLDEAFGIVPEIDLPRAYERYTSLLLIVAEDFGPDKMRIDGIPAGDALLLTHAINVARAGLEFDPESADLWEHLGLASLLHGDADGAITALTRFDELEHDVEPGVWFALAMAHHARGEEATARDWYLRAITWMAQHPSRQATQSEWFRVEAAKQLGFE